MNERTSPGHPEGLKEEHSAAPRGLARHASPFSILLLAALMAAAFSGILGGHPSPVRRVNTAAADLEVKMPAVIRNGEFFETQIRVVPHRPIGDLVIAVTPSLWRDLTINTMIPAAVEEAYANGAYRFSYGPMEPGQALIVKIDSQINPSLFRGTAGSIRLFDGDVPLADLPMRMKVLP